MSVNEDIVKRLRHLCPGCQRLECKAADEIERLRKEIERIKEEKAADWKACSESALAASVEINNLRAMVREFVHRS